MGRTYTDEELEARKQEHLNNIKKIERELAERKKKQEEKNKTRAYNYLRNFIKHSTQFTGMTFEEALTHLERKLEERTAPPAPAPVEENGYTGTTY